MLQTYIYALIVPVCAILFFLAQLYLSTRPGRVWGLIMPAIFLLVFLAAVMGFSLIPNKQATTFFAVLGGAGAVIYFIEYLFGRQLRRTKLARKEEARLSRRISHKQRLLDKAAACGDETARAALSEELTLLAAEHETAAARLAAEEKRFFSPKKKQRVRGNKKNAEAACEEAELEWEYEREPLPVEAAPEEAEETAAVEEAAEEVAEEALEETAEEVMEAASAEEITEEIAEEAAAAAVDVEKMPRSRTASGIRAARKKGGKRR